MVLQESPTEYQAKPFGGSVEAARNAGLKSAQVRRANAHRIAAFDRITSEILPAVELLVNSAQNPKNHPRTPEIELLEAQISRLDKVMEQDLTPKDWNQAAQAKMRLIEAWAWLSGIPKPMAGREPRQTQRRVSLTPIDIDPPSVPSAPPAASAPAQIPEVNRDVTP